MSTALIVGASRGLGRALAEEHLKRGWNVIATVRKADALADIAQDALQVEILEMADWAGIEALKKRLNGQKLDLIFVNAGIASDASDEIGTADIDAFTKIMLINTLAPLRIVDRLADLSADDGTIAVMSSSLASIENNTVGGGETYRISKAGLNMGLRSVAARRADRRTYMCIDPGWVQTDMGGPNAPLTMDQSIPGIANELEKHYGKGGTIFVNHAGQYWPW